MTLKGAKFPVLTHLDKNIRLGGHIGAGRWSRCEMQQATIIRAEKQVVDVDNYVSAAYATVRRKICVDSY
jgi:hypothetical protein